MGFRRAYILVLFIDISQTPIVLAVYVPNKCLWNWIVLWECDWEQRISFFFFWAIRKSASNRKTHYYGFTECSINYRNFQMIKILRGKRWIWSVVRNQIILIPPIFHLLFIYFLLMTLELYKVCRDHYNLSGGKVLG